MKVGGFCAMLLLCAGLFAGGGKEKGANGITFVSMWNTGEPEMLFLQEVAKSFEQETGMSVKFTWAGRDVLNKLRTSFLSGDVPDLIDQGWADITEALVTNREELLQDIGDLYQQSPPGEQAKLSELIDQKIVDLYRVNGKMYFFPLKLVTNGFFYDKTLFAQHGVSPPNTWDEFIAVNRKLKQDGVAPLSLDGNINGYDAYYYYWALQRVLGDRGFFRAASDKSGETWKEEGYLQAAKMVYQLSSGGEDFFQSGYQGSNWPAAQADWAMNGGGSILVGSWIASETKKQQVATFRVGFYPFPTVAGGRGKRGDVEIAPYGFAIPKEAKNAEGAKQFLVYLMGKDRQNLFVKMTDNFSPRKDIAYPELLSDLKPYLAQASSYHTEYDHVRQSYPEWFARVFYELDNALIFGTMTPEEFIDGLATQSKKFWEQKG